MKTHALLLSMAFSFLATAACAQAVAPQASTETFDNWTLHCQKLPQATPSDPAVRMCEVVSTVVDSRQQQVLRLAIGIRPQDKGKRAVVAQLPVNIRISRPIQIVSDAGDKTFPFSYQVCAAVGCFAETDQQDSLIQWMTANPKARMQLRFADAQGNPVALPLAAQGFSAAWSAFQAEQAKKP